MTFPVVLDAAGLDALTEARPPEALRAILLVASRRDRAVIVPAVVCAEMCRGAARTRQVESALARHSTRSAQRPAVTVAVTDFDLARQVGAVLDGSGMGTEAMVDAHVVAVCVKHGGGLVVTADRTDVARLAAAVPAIRVVTSPPR